MPTINSMYDKVFGNGGSQKSFKTIDLQRNREKKISQMRGDRNNRPSDELDWRSLEIISTVNDK